MSRTWKDRRRTVECPAISDADLLATIGGEPEPQRKNHHERCDLRATQPLPAWSDAALYRLLVDVRAVRP
jgi:hypothetical protein